MATNTDSSWEVVDGVQRLSTLIHFCGDQEQIDAVGRPSPLKLAGLMKLNSFNGLTFTQLPVSVQMQFSLRSLRVTTLNDKSDHAVRYDLFERLNTGGIKLHPQEIRNCVFRGRLQEQIQLLAENESFRELVVLSENEQKMAGYEECVLRFFAYLNHYEEFEHSVVGFLNDFMENRAKRGLLKLDLKTFEETMEFLRQHLPNGISRGGRRKTPINLYEAVSVGVALALRSGRKLHGSRLPAILERQDLKDMTTGATNNRSMVIGRINLVRDRLI